MKPESFLAPEPVRGGAPVGRCDELAPAERAAVAYLRLWLTGGQRAVSQDFEMLLGAADASEAIAAFADLTRALGRRARPFPHHAPGCACFGGDESAFAQLLSAAAAGDEEGATGFALHLFSGHPPPAMVARAARLGLAVQHMAALLSRPRALH